MSRECSATQLLTVENLFKNVDKVPVPPKPTKRLSDPGFAVNQSRDKTDQDLDNLLSRHRAEQARVHRLRSLADIR